MIVLMVEHGRLSIQPPYGQVSSKQLGGQGEEKLEQKNQTPQRCNKLQLLPILRSVWWVFTLLSLLGDFSLLGEMVATQPRKISKLQLIRKGDADKQLHHGEF